MHDLYLLASAQKTVGYVVAVILLLAFVVAIAVNVRKGRAEVGSEVELAPNRKPYMDDEELETKKLDRTLGLGLVALGVIALALPLYWLAEPSRQTDMVKDFQNVAVSRGENIYVNAAQCANCHGPNGVGGAASYTILDPKTGAYVDQVQWKAPALNTVMYRYTPEQVTYILNYGRGYSPMPAWGAPGGGPLGTAAWGRRRHGATGHSPAAHPCRRPGPTGVPEPLPSPGRGPSGAGHCRGALPQADLPLPRLDLRP